MENERLVRLLFVEDDPDIQKIAKLVLESVGGFTVKICPSGREAVKQAPEFQPQLIITDMMMPGMDGLATLKALREIPSLQSVPIVIMTAKVQAAEVEHYKKMGALDVIRKPFEPMSLHQNILDIWGRSRG